VASQERLLEHFQRPILIMYRGQTSCKRQLTFTLTMTCEFIRGRYWAVKYRADILLEGKWSGAKEIWRHDFS